MERKDSLVFYLSQYEAIKSLNNEQLGRLFRAIFEKQLQNNSKTTEKEVVLEDDIIIAFNFINNQLLVDNEKYLKRCETNRNNGKKGGAPKGNKNAQRQPKQPNGVKNKPNDNENENDNENDIKEKQEKEKKYEIFSYIENNFGVVIGGTNYEKIKEYLKIYNDEVLCYAIDLCVLNDVTTLSYFCGIVENWISLKLTTLKEIKSNEKKFKSNSPKEEKIERRTF